MKTILFNAFRDDGHSRRLDLALDLARHLEGHLTLLNAVPLQATITADPYGAAFAAMIPIWREDARKLREQTEADLANEDVPWDWIEDAGPVSSSLLGWSALADIVVVGAREPRPGGTSPSFTAGELALSADCPVLVLPEDATRLALDQPAFVAWDGSAEASHALRAAVPLLKKAESVFLASVEEGKKEKSSQFDLPSIAGADYLAKHGIACEMVELGHDGTSVAGILTKAAAARNCGLIVIGAYGRMRIAERIFGGVTREMLSDVRIPVLLRH